MSKFSKSRFFLHSLIKKNFKMMYDLLESDKKGCSKVVNRLSKVNFEKIFQELKFSVDPKTKKQSNHTLKSLGITPNLADTKYKSHI